MTIKLLGVCGSTREHSYSGRVALIALAAAREHGADTRLLELNAINLPNYNPDKEDMDHEGLRAWLIDDKARVQRAGSRRWQPLKDVIAEESAAAGVGNHGPVVGFSPPTSQRWTDQCQG